MAKISHPEFIRQLKALSVKYYLAEDLLYFLEGNHPGNAYKNLEELIAVYNLDPEDDFADELKEEEQKQKQQKDLEKIITMQAKQAEREACAALVEAFGCKCGCNDSGEYEEDHKDFCPISLAAAIRARESVTVQSTTDPL